MRRCSATGTRPSITDCDGVNLGLFHPGEMGATFGNAGLPEGFHRAAAEIHAPIAGPKDTDAPALEVALRALNG